MVGILIVDDDALVRMFLKQIVPWEEHGYTVVGDACEGEEALEKIQELRPDILLTDMSMSGMDGLELIERAKADGFDGGVVVLSCHEDFSYVKLAMQLGADEYLLKNHLNGPELLRVMDLVRDKMESRRIQSDRLHVYAKRGLRAMQHELLEALLARPGLPIEEQHRMTEAAGLHGRYDCCAVVLAQLPASAEGQSARLIELCGQFAAKYRAEAVRFQKDSCALLVDLSDEPSAGAQREIIQALSAAVANYADRYLGLRVSEGISRVHQGNGALCDALHEAHAALVSAFYKEGIYWCDAGAGELTELLPPAAESFERELGSLIRRGAAAQLVEGFHAALAQIGETRMQPGAVLYWLRRCDLAAGITREEREYAALRTFADYEAMAEAYLRQAQQRGDLDLPEELSPAIETAVGFIRAHFSEQLTLAQVAAQAGLTQNYFSSLFKQEVGVGFSAYLTECRLQCVCRRLREGNEMIKQIAAEAGFLDYQHFCRTFRKHMGVSPAEYRRAPNAADRANP